jgi:hypothetical protein
MMLCPDCRVWPTFFSSASAMEWMASGVAFSFGNDWKSSVGVTPACLALNQMASSPAMIRSSSPLIPSNTSSGRSL